MTLKSIIKTISNDKTLSILILFVFILIGTLMYYNLNEELLNYNSRTLEYFYTTDDGCDSVRELLNNPNEFEIYEMKDINGTVYEYLIINVPSKEEQIMYYMKNHIKKYINELNEKFSFDNMECILLKPENMNVTSIREIIVTYMSFENNTILNESMDDYENDINTALTNYNTSGTNTDLTITPISKTNEYIYVTDIYKIILKIIFKNKINETIKNITINISKYTNNPTNWRKKRIRNKVKSLHKFSTTLKFISDDANFDSKINSNLLNYTTNENGNTIRYLENNTVGFGTNVFDLSANFNNDESSLLYNYIQNNDAIFKDFITDSGMMVYLKEMYETNDFGYFHVFNNSQSIVQRYTSTEYDACRETIDYENGSV